MAEVQLLVTCSKRKTRPPVPALMLRSVGHQTVAGRMGVWLERLRRPQVETIRVEELYAGDHWSVVRSIARSTPSTGLRIRLWICSAGYGLLSWDSRIASYAATFSSGQADSVARGDQTRSLNSAIQEWWKLLAQWKGPAPGSPRSVTELIRTFSRSFFILAVSPPYLRALASDLQEAMKELSDRDRFSVLSAGTGAREEGAENIVPCNARLQSVVGGARASLNVRLARMALQELNGDEPRFSVLQDRFSRLLRQQPRRSYSARKPMTDEQVRAYIRNALQQNARARPSPLLARLRMTNKACEQSRFVTLYREIEEDLHGA